VQQEEANFDGYPREVRLRGYKPTFEAHPVQIKKAAKLLNEAQRPLIIAGHGVIIAGAHQELKDLAEKAQVPVLNTLLGLGSFPRNHVLSVGMLGMHGMAWANLAVGEADLVLGIGIRFDDRITGRLSDFAKKAKIVHIDIDPAEIGKNVKTDVPIVGDVKRVLRDLVKEVQPSTHLPWLEQVENWKREHPSIRIHEEPGKLLPQRVLKELSDFTQGNDIYVTGVGQHQMWAAQYIFSPRMNNFISSGGLGTMGFELPAAMGASLGMPDDTVWCIAGDGGFQMTIQELATVAEHNIPVKVVLVNNAYLGMVRQWQELFYGRRFNAVEFAPAPAAEELHKAAVQDKERFWPDYVKLAEAYGIPGLRVTRTEDVRAALATARERQGPFLIDFIVEPQENVYPMVPPGASLAETIEDPRDARVPAGARPGGHQLSGGGGV
jgi:acetolactate synthase-1/2/3 large subunit